MSQRESAVSTVTPPVQARVYSLSQQEARDAPDVVTGTCSVSAQFCSVLFDSGASHSFVSESFVERLPVGSFTVAVVPSLSVLLPTGDRLVVGQTCTCEIEIDLSILASLFILVHP